MQAFPEWARKACRVHAWRFSDSAFPVTPSPAAKKTSCTKNRTAVDGEPVDDEPTAVSGVKLPVASECPPPLFPMSTSPLSPPLPNLRNTSRSPPDAQLSLSFEFKDSNSGPPEGKEVPAQNGT